MSEIETRFVHRGLWTDVGRGSTMGRTITTDTRTSTLIVALLAILCSLATGHLWNLVTFFVYQYRASGRHSDALYRQQQVILRTFPTPGALIVDFAKLYWAWRPTKTHRPATRILPLIMLALLFAVTTVVTGIFSSFVVDTLNLLVLVDSPFCGPIDLSESTQLGVFANYTPIVESLAEPMAQDCYRDATSSSARCKIYSRPRIPFGVTREDCPWPSSMCYEHGHPAVSMDSNLLDMNDAFGLNLPLRDRVQFRKKTSCAVLPLDNRTTIVPITAYPGYLRRPLPDEELLILNFGDFPGNSTWKNATFGVSLVTANVTDRFVLRYVNLLVDLHGHQTTNNAVLKVIRKFASYALPEWGFGGVLDPLPELRRNDADLVLKLVIKGRVAYDNPVDDPVFSAHKLFTTFDETSGSNVSFYFPDFPVSVLGCTQQYQFCVSPDSCTSLNYLPRQLTRSEFPDASNLQLAVLQLLITSAYLFDISSAQSVSVASDIRIGGYIASLPNDQWVTEVVGWEAITWASLQIAIGDYFTGAKARDLFADAYVKRPETDGEKKLCGMQRIRKSGAVVNINMFAIAFVCTFAILVVTIDTALLKFLIYMSRFRHARWIGPRLERWIQDGALQLQRRAFEAQRQGSWISLDKEVPITIKRETLSDF